MAETSYKSPTPDRDEALVEKLLDVYAKGSAAHFKDCHGCGGGAHRAGLLAVYSIERSESAQPSEDDDQRDVREAWVTIMQGFGADRLQQPGGYESYHALAKAIVARFAAPSASARTIPESIVKSMLAGQRLDVIEECAVVADEFQDPEHVHNIVAAIRALKPKSPGYMGDVNGPGCDPDVP